LDTNEIQRYVKAMDDPSLPEARFAWRDRHTAVIDATMKPDEVVSVQVTYSPGWRATIDGAPVSVSKDGLGFLLLKPAWHGRCQMVLVYDGGIEWRATCLASLVAFTVGLWCLVISWRPILQPDPVRRAPATQPQGIQVWIGNRRVKDGSATHGG
jgi:hypothetical protein